MEQTSERRSGDEGLMRTTASHSSVLRQRNGAQPHRGERAEPTTVITSELRQPRLLSARHPATAVQGAAPLLPHFMPCECVPCAVPMVAHRPGAETWCAGASASNSGTEAVSPQAKGISVRDSRQSNDRRRVGKNVQ